MHFRGPNDKGEWRRPRTLPRSATARFPPSTQAPGSAVFAVFLEENKSVPFFLPIRLPICAGGSHSKLRGISPLMRRHVLTIAAFHDHCLFSTTQQVSYSCSPSTEDFLDVFLGEIKKEADLKADQRRFQSLSFNNYVERAFLDNVVSVTFRLCRRMTYAPNTPNKRRESKGTYCGPNPDGGPWTCQDSSKDQKKPEQPEHEAKN